MRLTSRQIKDIVVEIDRHRVKQGLSVSALAKKAGVHQSQVSRVLAKDFKIMSQNVMQICISLGMQVPAIGRSDISDVDREKIINSAIAVWNGTSADAEALVELFDQIARLRR
jgi:lambda repressor-like predicted transcriptional regulator